MNCRWSSNRQLNIVQISDFRIHKKWGLSAKKAVKNSAEEEMSDNGRVVKKKTSRTSKRGTTPPTRKKPKADEIQEGSDLEINSEVLDEETIVSASSEDTVKKPPRTRRNGTLFMV